MLKRSVDDIVTEFVQKQISFGRTVVRAADVGQAVEVAEVLKEKGEADWFRGQIQDWRKLAPTYARCSEQDRAMAKLERFSAWARDVEGLEDLETDGDSDRLIAVAQHYGIPTNFLDFTTDPRVAGFFASDGAAPPTGTDSCIICLHRERAAEIWESVKLVRPGDPIPELLEIDVSNLWRLEAQRGTFVWCPYDDLNVLFPLDRIVFPYTGLGATPREAIYPANESPLEHLVNHFFQEEQIREGMTRLQEEVVRRIPGFNVLGTGDAQPYLRECFLYPPERHASWPTAGSAWTTVTREHWDDVVAGRRIEIHLESRQAQSVVDSLAAQVLDTLDGMQQRRHRSLHWLVAEASVPRSHVNDRLRRALQRVWEGMSRLPYSDQQVAHAMGETASLILLHERVHNRDQVARQSYANPTALELGGPGENVHSFAWAEEESIRQAVRDDFPALLAPDQRKRVLALIFNILMSARDPRLLFDFGRVTELFASQIIPSQVALDYSNPTIFSPARLDVLGPA